MSDKTSSRRGFFIKAAAAMSAPAAVAGPGRGSPDEGAAVQARLAELEDINALRALSTQLARAINAGSAQLLESLEAEVQQITLADFDETAEISLSANRRSASVHLACSARFAEPIVAPGSALLDMARAQGEGSVSRVRSSVLEMHCERTASGWTLAAAKLIGAD